MPRGRDGPNVDISVHRFVWLTTHFQLLFHTEMHESGTAGVVTDRG